MKSEMTVKELKDILNKHEDDHMVYLCIFADAYSVPSCELCVTNYSGKKEQWKGVNMIMECEVED